MYVTISPRWAAAVFRALFSLIFLVAGLNHLVAPDKVAARLANAPLGSLATQLGPPELLVVLAGVALVMGGAALLTGYRVRYASMLLIAVLIPITLTVQVGGADLGPLFKNIALLGGLIFFASSEVQP